MNNLIAAKQLTCLFVELLTPKVGYSIKSKSPTNKYLQSPLYTSNVNQFKLALDKGIKQDKIAHWIEVAAPVLRDKVSPQVTEFLEKCIEREDLLAVEYNKEPVRHQAVWDEFLLYNVTLDQITNSGKMKDYFYVSDLWEYYEKAGGSVFITLKASITLLGLVQKHGLEIVLRAMDALAFWLQQESYRSITIEYFAVYDEFWKMAYNNYNTARGYSLNGN